MSLFFLKNLDFFSEISLNLQQNMKLAIKLVNLFYVMGKGKVAFKGDRETLLEADEVRNQYLEV